MEVKFKYKVFYKLEKFYKRVVIPYYFGDVKIKTKKKDNNIILTFRAHKYNAFIKMLPYIISYSKNKDLSLNDEKVRNGITNTLLESKLTKIKMNFNELTKSIKKLTFIGIIEKGVECDDGWIIIQNKTLVHLEIVKKYLEIRKCKIYLDLQRGFLINNEEYNCCQLKWRFDEWRDKDIFDPMFITERLT